MVLLRDIAKLAGVSPSTVSRVINHSAEVAEEKRQRVLEVIKETGFVPNDLARAFYNNSAKIIGVIFPDISNPFFNDVVNAIEKEIYSQGYRMMIFFANDETEKLRSVINILEMLQAEGIILMSNAEDLQEAFKNSTTPVVAFDREAKTNREFLYIHSDNREGGRIATEYMIQCGCKNLIHVRGPQRFSTARERFAGYREICNMYQVEPKSFEVEYTFEAGKEAGREILKSYPEVDGIIAANDIVAAAIMKELQRSGKKIPEEVQIIGFDDIILSQILSPELTTIKQQVSEMGKAAVRAIIDYKDEKEKHGEIIFSVDLVKRESTKEKIEDKKFRKTDEALSVSDCQDESVCSKKQTHDRIFSGGGVSSAIGMKKM